MTHVEYHTLQDIKSAKPQFFKNKQKGTSETYRVRKNHLIVLLHNPGEANNGKIVVWQYHHNGAMQALTPVWYAPHTSRGDAFNMELADVIAEVAKRLADGRLPLHPEGGYDYDALRIEEEQWVCYRCGEVRFFDPSVEVGGYCEYCQEKLGDLGVGQRLSLTSRSRRWQDDR